MDHLWKVKVKNNHLQWNVQNCCQVSKKNLPCFSIMCSSNFSSGRSLPSFGWQSRHLWGRVQESVWQERLDGRATTLVALLDRRSGTECLEEKCCWTLPRSCRRVGGWHAIHWKKSDLEEFICKYFSLFEWKFMIQMNLIPVWYQPSACSIYNFICRQISARLKRRV